MTRRAEMAVRRADPGSRWVPHPTWSWCLRAFALTVPLVASMAAGIWVSRALPEPSGAAGTLGWYLAIIIATVAALLIVERLARRLLPLAMLLRLSLAFPDQAPSHVRVARRAGNARRLGACVEAVIAGTGDADPEAIVTLAAALNAHDRRTRGHSERVRALSELVGEELGLDPLDRERLRWAAFLHDIGKLSVPSRVLNKPGRLDGREWRLVRKHPAVGERYAGALAAWLGDWIHSIGHHHEHWDGTGYPDGLVGSKISLGGRIVAVTDAFETMTTLRSYNRPMTAEEGRAELTRCAGMHFDPRVVRAFVGISIPTLRWKVGLASWLAQLPFLGVPARAGAQVVTAAAGVQGSTGPVVAAMATVAAGVATPLTPVVASLSLDHPVPGAVTGAHGASVDFPDVETDPVTIAQLTSGSDSADERPSAPPVDLPALPAPAQSVVSSGNHTGWITGNHDGWTIGSGNENGDPPHGFGG